YAAIVARRRASILAPGPCSPRPAPVGRGARSDVPEREHPTLLAPPPQPSCTPRDIGASIAWSSAAEDQGARGAPGSRRLGRVHPDPTEAADQVAPDRRCAIVRAWRAAAA